MYHRFGKSFYFLSIALFVFFLLYFYAALPEKVSYSLDSGAELISRSSFFYGMIAAFIIINLAVLLPPKLLETKSNRSLSSVFPKGDNYRDYFLTWFYSFGGIINFSLAFLVFYTHALNNQEELAASEYNLFFYLIPILFAVWVVSFFIILVGKFTQVKNKS
ncbi:DNA topoisomerase IV [Algoriphagus halophytocola]|uniref:DNA topoisomerase IV n=1 Tax=Algoriphagus halophytocola TaxID=2991499 RepID=A0ABY6MIS0_9BACT|nr:MULTISPECIES: DNA topoisomerase IV [unclassified Algoriphagus]UZD23374.1 DNA topoisomerase IV [Algoriphagus sp. TR-M5]WBL44669.1 DNA topoisomerase IV [Algoriphagus sp. TR-M9]